MEIAINHDRHCAVMGEEEIRLPSLEYQLFELLISQPGRTFSKSEIGVSIWGTDVPDTTIEKVTSRLRERLGYETLETRRGFGYSINSKVTITDVQRNLTHKKQYRGRYIYIMSIGFDDIYKIGVAVDPIDRCAGAAAFNPRLKLLAYGLSSIATAHENIIHNTFNKSNVNRELFRLSKRQLFQAINILNSMCQEKLFIDVSALVDY